MSATEIILIVIGVAVFLLGYLMPVRKKDLDEEGQLIGEEEVRKMVAGEVEHVKDRIDDIVDETVSYSIEKTERAIERITNEKILAINEYSDTVLEEINKNHNEVVFLYDMLNDKHDNLMSMINEATIAADEIKQTVKDSEITVGEVTNRLETVTNTVNGAEKMIRDAEESAMQAQKAVQDAMYSVMNTVENAKKDLASLQSVQPYPLAVTEEKYEILEEEPVESAYQGELYDLSKESEPVRETVVDESALELQNVMAELSAAEEAASAAEEEVEFTPIAPKRVEVIYQPDDDDTTQDEEDISTSAAFASLGLFAAREEEPERADKRVWPGKDSSKDRAQDSAPSVDIQFTQGKDNSSNSNERILMLHKAGKSNMAIARDLGLGLGEVKLVIDLFEGM